MVTKVNTRIPKSPFKEVSLIYWLDTYVTTDDNPMLDHKNDLTISIGVIIKDDDKQITLSDFWDGVSLEFASPFQVIPKCAIKHIKRLRT
jgi:hypothetical protein